MAPRRAWSTVARDRLAERAAPALDPAEMNEEVAELLLRVGDA